jgi:hypothetical protein
MLQTTLNEKIFQLLKQENSELKLQIQRLFRPQDLQAR